MHIHSFTPVSLDCFTIDIPSIHSSHLISPCVLWLSVCFVLYQAYMKNYCPISCRGAEKRPIFQKECKDAHARCSIWADLGECDDNAEMRKYCASSCDTCHHTVEKAGTGKEEEEWLCTDDHANCKFWADKGECTINAVVSQVNMT
jgi:hypothetical protein